MRIFVLAATIAAAAFVPLSGASAQSWRHHGGYNSEVREELRECRRELRRADSHREYRRERRECRRELREARRDDARRGWHGRGHGNAWGHRDRRHRDGRRWRSRW